MEARIGKKMGGKEEERKGKGRGEREVSGERDGRY